MALIDNLTLEQQLELVYVGYFNRAAEPAGLVYWEGQYASATAAGQSPADAIDNIANAFSTQSETTKLYPFLGEANPDYGSAVVQAQVEGLIDQIYRNLFNRPSDDDGRNYWAKQLETGAVGLGQIVLDIANGAKAGSGDFNLLSHKIATALDFTQSAASAGYGETEPMPQGFANEAHYVLTLDTADSDAAAANEIADFVNGVGANLPYDETVIDLTTAIDNAVGTGAHNLFVGTLNGGGGVGNNNVPELKAAVEAKPADAPGTLNPGDSITGAGVDNTLKIVTTGDPTIDLNSVAISGVQTLVIDDTSHALSGNAYVGAGNSFAHIEAIDVASLNLYQVNEGTSVAYRALGGGGYVDGQVYFSATTATSVTIDDTVTGAPNMTGGMDVVFVHGQQGAGLSAAQNISATLNLQNMQIENEDGYGTAYQYIYADNAGNAGATINTVVNVADNASDGSDFDTAKQYIYQTGDAHVNAVVNVSDTTDAQVSVYANYNAQVVANAADDAATINLSHVASVHGKTAVGAYGFDSVTVNVTGDAVLTGGLNLYETNSTTASTNAQTVTIDASANLKIDATHLDYNGSTALVVKGSGNVDLGSYTASGDEALSGASGAVVSSSIDASALTGNLSVDVQSAINTVKGGAGDDVILLENVQTFGNASSGGLIADGGAGVNTIGFSETEWTQTIATGASTALAGVTHFQTLEITTSLHDDVFDVSALAGSPIVNFVAGAGVANGATASVTHLTDGSTVTLEGAGAAGTLDVSLTTDSAAPTLNLVLNLNFPGDNGATSTATPQIENVAAVTDIATLNVDSTGTNTGLPFTPVVGYKADTVTNELSFTDAALVTLKVSGDQVLEMTLGAAFTKLATVDASANTAGLTLDVHGIAATQALTIAGTSGADRIEVGGGADTITLNGGADTVAFFSPSASSAIFTTIEDIVAGDVLSFLNTTITNVGAQLGASLTSAVNDYQTFLSTGASKSAGTISWFQYGGDTYLEVSGGNAKYTAGSDSVVKLAGLHDLSHAEVTTGAGGALTIA